MAANPVGWSVGLPRLGIPFEYMGLGVAPHGTWHVGLVSVKLTQLWSLLNYNTCVLLVFTSPRLLALA